MKLKFCKLLEAVVEVAMTYGEPRPATVRPPEKVEEAELVTARIPAKVLALVEVEVKVPTVSLPIEEEEM